MTLEELEIKLAALPQEAKRAEVLIIGDVETPIKIELDVEDGRIRYVIIEADTSIHHGPPVKL